jgi:hypothetical protein
LPALRWRCLPYCNRVFAQHHSCHSVVVVPGLVVISSIGQHCCLWQSTQPLHWCLCQRCAGVVSLIVQASLHNILVIGLLLSYPASLLSTASANIVICGGHLWHCIGVISLMALAFLPSLCWRLPAHNLIVACCIVVALVLLLYAASSPYTPLATLSSHAALLSRWLCFCAPPRCHTRCCCCCLRRLMQICHAPCRRCLLLSSPGMAYLLFWCC